jgi:hypothetical protein
MASPARLRCQLGVCLNANWEIYRERFLKEAGE